MGFASLLVMHLIGVNLQFVLMILISHAANSQFPSFIFSLSVIGLCGHYQLLLTFSALHKEFVTT